MAHKGAHGIVQGRAWIHAEETNAEEVEQS
jgi:hypothetical protein